VLCSLGTPEFTPPWSCYLPWSPWVSQAPSVIWLSPREFLSLKILDSDTMVQRGEDTWEPPCSALTTMEGTPGIKEEPKGDAPRKAGWNIQEYEGSLWVHLRWCSACSSETRIIRHRTRITIIPHWTLARITCHRPVKTVVELILTGQWLVHKVTSQNKS